MNSLYAVYQNAEEGFAERYLAMLSAGGTKHHSELLAPFGGPRRGRQGVSHVERSDGTRRD